MSDTTVPVSTQQSESMSDPVLWLCLASTIPGNPEMPAAISASELSGLELLEYPWYRYVDAALALIVQR